MHSFSAHRGSIFYAYTHVKIIKVIDYLVEFDKICRNLGALYESEVYSLS